MGQTVGQNRNSLETALSWWKIWIWIIPPDPNNRKERKPSSVWSESTFEISETRQRKQNNQRIKQSHALSLSLKKQIFDFFFLFWKHVVFFFFGVWFPRSRTRWEAILQSQREISRSLVLQVLIYITLFLYWISLKLRFRYFEWFIYLFSFFFLLVRFLKLYNRDGVESIGLDDAASRLGLFLFLYWCF